MYYQGITPNEGWCTWLGAHALANADECLDGYSE